MFDSKPVARSVHLEAWSLFSKNLNSHCRGINEPNALSLFQPLVFGSLFRAADYSQVYKLELSDFPMARLNLEIGDGSVNKASFHFYLESVSFQLDISDYSGTAAGAYLLRQTRIYSLLCS